MGLSRRRAGRGEKRLRFPRHHEPLSGSRRARRPRARVRGGGRGQTGGDAELRILEEDLWRSQDRGQFPHHRRGEVHDRRRVAGGIRIAGSRREFVHSRSPDSGTHHREARARRHGSPGGRRGKGGPACIASGAARRRTRNAAKGPVHDGEFPARRREHHSAAASGDRTGARDRVRQHRKPDAGESQRPQPRVRHPECNRRGAAADCAAAADREHAARRCGRDSRPVAGLLEPCVPGHKTARRPRPHAARRGVSRSTLE